MRSSFLRKCTLNLKFEERSSARRRPTRGIMITALSATVALPEPASCLSSATLPDGFLALALFNVACTLEYTFK